MVNVYIVNNREKRIIRKDDRIVNLKNGTNYSRCMYISTKNRKNVLYSTGKYIQSFGIEHYGRWYEKKGIYIWLSHYAV